MHEGELRTPSRRQVIGLGAACVVAACAGCSSDDTEGDRPVATGEASAGFGGLVDAGTERQVRRRIQRDGLTYVPEARTYLVVYPRDRVAVARGRFPASIHPALDAGLLGLYQKCTHLGCRVPWCSSSSQFECPCHASVFSAAGEYRSGPAPRGLDLFPLVFEHGRVAIDTGTPVRGLAHGESPSGDAPTGPTCI